MTIASIILGIATGVIAALLLAFVVLIVSHHSVEDAFRKAADAGLAADELPLGPLTSNYQQNIADARAEYENRRLRMADEFQARSSMILAEGAWTPEQVEYFKEAFERARADGSLGRPLFPTLLLEISVITPAEAREMMDAPADAASPPEKDYRCSHCNTPYTPGTTRCDACNAPI